MPILADVGVPMIFIQWPLMLCALVPVIVVEALLIRRWVSLSPRQAFIGIGKANLLSTLVGVPLAWLAMLVLEFTVLAPVSMAVEKWKWQIDGPVWQVLLFLFGAAWFGPAEGYLHWLVPAAVALLLVPCFYLSVVIERRSCTRTWVAADPARVRKGVFAVNLASYALLFILACGWVTYELVTKGSHVQNSHADQAAPPSDDSTTSRDSSNSSGGGGHR